jgi:phosphate transport system ATP-binding protein
MANPDDSGAADEASPRDAAPEGADPAGEPGAGGDAPAAVGRADSPVPGLEDALEAGAGGGSTTPESAADLETALEARDLGVAYDGEDAVTDITLTIPRNRVVAFIGPSGCGKSTLLRCFNRMNDLIPAAEVRGEVLFHGTDLYGPDVDPVEVRRRIGMVFQKPNPFPKSVYENIAFGLRTNGYRGDVEEKVEWSLRHAALWDEVKDRLDRSALDLSGGQQQRLCIARALAVEPEILLMDEPASALDPIATGRIEDLIADLKKQYTIVIVTHNMQQAARVSDFTAFLYMGELVEYGDTDQIFTNPREKRTEQYITGRFG